MKNNNYKIPFVNFKKRFLKNKKELIKNFSDVGMSGNYILGKNVLNVEKKLAKICQVPYVVAVNSGFDAIKLGLLSYNINKNDEVLTVSNSYIATASAIIAVSAKPVFIDVDETYNIDVKKIISKITKKTKAIMPVHLAGMPANMLEIIKIAKKYNLLVFEDCAQAIGASINNKRVGSFGKLGFFSLHPLKNMHVLGDGGFITVKNKKKYEQLKLLRNNGHFDRDNIYLWGHNSRLDELQASISRVFLSNLDIWQKKVNKIAAIYRKFLQEPVLNPVQIKNYKSVYHNYIIRVPMRNKLIAFLDEYGIETKIHYPIPIHLQNKIFRKKNITLKNTEMQRNEILSLPIYPELSESNALLITKKINEFYEKNNF